jgi:AmiR/NasT family two-component response regulator
LDQADTTLAQGLADIATISLMQQRTLDHVHTEAANLQYALSSRIILEQVKGILAERWACTLDSAFAALTRYARANGLKLTTLAREIADGSFDTTAIPRPTP